MGFRISVALATRLVDYWTPLFSIHDVKEPASVQIEDDYLWTLLSCVFLYLNFIDVNIMIIGGLYNYWF
jgi:hypothetical protein